LVTWICIVPLSIGFEYMYFSSNKALEQTAWDQLVIGMGLLKDREMPVGSARLLSIVVRRLWVTYVGQGALASVKLSS
jgi:hypothetical protein